MPRYSSDHVPQYQNHKQSGGAFVRLSGKTYPLGKFGSPDSKVKYYDLIARWLAGGRRPLSPVAPLPDDPTQPPPPHLLTVGVLLDAYIRHADDYYKKPDGTSTGEPYKIRLYTEPLRKMFGDTLASGFGPTKLEIVRDEMIKKGWARNSINSGIHLVRRIFRWGVAKEIVNSSVLVALEALDPLKAGRSKAVETDPIQSVSVDDINAIRPFVSPVVWSMVQIQLLTGMRSGELVALKATEIDRSKPVWTYAPAGHKTAYRGHKRTVYIGPKAQAILTGYIVADRPIGSPIFSPRESLALAKAAKAVKGKSRRPNQKPNRRKTMRAVGDAFSVDSYRRAIARACKLAEIDPWHPHRLRHTFATAIRASHGADVSLTLLGDKTTRMIDVYAEKDHAAAMRVAAVVG